MNRLAINGSRTVHIDLEWCKACGICERVCPSDAITSDARGFPVLSEDFCVACRSCILACPDYCIELVEREA